MGYKAVKITTFCVFLLTTTQYVDIIKSPAVKEIYRGIASLA